MADVKISMPKKILEDPDLGFSGQVLLILIFTGKKEVVQMLGSLTYVLWTLNRILNTVDSGNSKLGFVTNFVY